MPDNKPPQTIEPVDDLTPTEFELLVKSWFEAQSAPIEDFDAQHREVLGGVDGEYEIDVSIRFTVFGGARIHILAECKNHKNPIKREVVQILNDRLRSTGAHKGFVVSTAPFQSGALAYAKTNGIALVQVASGHTAYIQRAFGDRPSLPPGFPTLVGWHLIPNNEGNIEHRLISERSHDHLASLLKTE